MRLSSTFFSNIVSRKTKVFMSLMSLKHFFKHDDHIELTEQKANALLCLQFTKHKQIADMYFFVFAFLSTLAICENILIT